MTRNEITEQYNVDASGVIRSPGKFEAEMLYVPYFWDAGLDGCSSEDFGSVQFFVIEDSERTMFPEIGNIYGLALEESKQGFVNCQEYDSKAEYDVAVENFQAAEAAEQADEI